MKYTKNEFYSIFIYLEIGFGVKDNEIYKVIVHFYLT